MNSKMRVKFGFFMIGILSMFINGVAKASILKNKEVRCSTMNSEKNFTLGDKFLTFIPNSNKADFDSKRGISSSVSVRSKMVGKGMLQTTTYEGQKHKIYIRDLSKFDEIHDFLSITSAQGHEMTYPITCKYN